MTGDEVSDRVAQVGDRESHLGREGVVHEEGVVEVRGLEVVQLLRAMRCVPEGEFQVVGNCFLM